MILLLKNVELNSPKGFGQKWAIKVGFRTIFDGFQTLYTKTN